jgi:flagellar biosynthesis/type III secretory pathway protein FliH
MVLAHLATLEASGDEGSLFARKRQVMRSLYERGMPKQMVLELLRLVDWMMRLPQALEALFRQEHEQWEMEKQMPYITSFERLAREEGRAEGQAEGRAEGLRQGLLEAIELGLKLRFGAEGLQCFSAIQQLADIDVLRRIKQAIESAVTADDIRRLLP